MNNFSVAFVGAGNMANEHAKAFTNIPDVKISGICSRSNHRSFVFANQHSIPTVYESIDSLFLGTQANLVIVAVSELSIRNVCMEVFKYPWKVLIEKPVGFNLAEAQQIISLAYESNCQAYVALNRRHYSSTRTVLNQLQSIDEQRLVQVFDQENPIAALEGGKPQLVVDNWMFANSIHLIDYFNMFCRGDLVSVEPVIQWNPDDPRFVLTKLHYSSGDIGIYQAIWNGPGPWAVSISTQTKRWEMRPLEQATVQQYKSRIIEPIAIDSWDIEFKPGLRFQAEEAVKAVKGEMHKLPTLEDGLKTMELISKIYGT